MQPGSSPVSAGLPVFVANPAWPEHSGLLQSDRLEGSAGPGSREANPELAPLRASGCHGVAACLQLRQSTSRLPLPPRGRAQAFQGLGGRARGQPGSSPPAGLTDSLASSPGDRGCLLPGCVSNSVRPDRRQPTRLHGPWDSPGKNTGVGCHFLLQCMKGKSAVHWLLIAVASLVARCRL